MQNSIERDQELDLLKGFSIFWVIIIHCIYWPNIIKQGVGVSMLLFEMPLIFLLIGATNIYAKKRTIRNFYFKRLYRILYPFWLYALVVIIYTAVTNSLSHKITFSSFITSWINPMGKFYTHERFLNWHLWFIGTYIILIFLMPLLMKAHNMKVSKYFMILFPAILLMLDMNIVEISDNYIRSIEYTRYVLFYGFWIMVGFYFLDLKKVRRGGDLIIPIYTATLGILLGIFYVFISDFIIDKSLDFNMQNAKFPPSFLFFCYSLIIMSVLFAFSSIIVRGMKKLSTIKFFDTMINAYNHSGFTIYLFHPFVFLVVYNIVDKFFKDNSKIANFIFFVITTTVISPLLGLSISSLEKNIPKATKNIHSLYKKWVYRLMIKD